MSDSHFVSIQNQKFQSTKAEKGQAGNSSRSFFRTATLPSQPCFAESDSAWTKYKTFWFLPCFQYQMSFDVWGIARLDRRACVANLKKTKFVSHFFSLNSIASGNYFNSKCLKKHWNLCSYFVFGWDVYRQQEGQKVLCIINVSFPIFAIVLVLNLCKVLKTSSGQEVKWMHDKVCFDCENHGLPFFSPPK